MKRKVVIEFVYEEPAPLGDPKRFQTISIMIDFILMHFRNNTHILFDHHQLNIVSWVERQEDTLDD